MRETLVSGTAKKAELPGWMAAGKTGTTQDHRDAWFVGYTGALIGTVWVGNDDGEPMKKVTGSGLPAEVWQAFMREAHRGLASQPLPGLQQGWLGPLVASNQNGSRGPAPFDPEKDARRVEGPTAHERSLLSRLFSR